MPSSALSIPEPNPIKSKAEPVRSISISNKQPSTFLFIARGKFPASGRTKATRTETRLPLCNTGRFLERDALVRVLRRF